MEDEPNRLAKGLVREELRHLYKTEFRSDVDAMRTQMAKFKMVYAQRTGATPRQIEKIKKDLKTFFEGFYRFDILQTMSKANTKRSHAALDTAFCWNVTKTAYERPDGDDIVDVSHMYEHAGQFKGFLETTLKLNFHRAVVVNQYALLSNVYQRVSVSDHMLYRLIDRGVCEKFPLACFSARFLEWLPYINALMLMGTHNGFIPFDEGGLILQSYRSEEPSELTEENQGWRIYDRFTLSAAGGREAMHYNEMVSPTNHPHSSGNPDLIAFNEYRITTYLNNCQLSTNRHWAKIQWAKLVEQFPNEFSKLMYLNTMLDTQPAAVALFSNPDSDFMHALRKFTSNPRYIDACRGFN